MTLRSLSLQILSSASQHGKLIRIKPLLNALLLQSRKLESSAVFSKVSGCHLLYPAVVWLCIWISLIFRKFSVLPLLPALPVWEGYVITQPSIQSTM